jgi:hypothetical protein
MGDSHWRLAARIPFAAAIGAQVRGITLIKPAGAAWSK